MGWWKGDDKSHTNPKLLAVGLGGTALFFRMVSWAAEHETDGRVPAHIIPSLSPELSERARRALLVSMVEARYGASGDGLLEVVGDVYLIHDYLDANPTHAELEARREQRRSAGAVGGRRSKPRAKGNQT